MLSQFSSLRIHNNYRYVAKAIRYLPKFSQADQYGNFLK